MGQQDLIQKTRFEKQIPFPILSAIAAEVKRLDTATPEQEINLETQHEIIYALSESLHDKCLLKIPDRDKLIAIAAEAIRAIKHIDKNFI